jgi:hypothetical protein
MQPTKCLKVGIISQQEADAVIYTKNVVKNEPSLPAYKKHSLDGMCDDEKYHFSKLNKSFRKLCFLFRNLNTAKKTNKIKRYLVFARKLNDFFSSDFYNLCEKFGISFVPFLKWWGKPNVWSVGVVGHILQFVDGLTMLQIKYCQRAFYTVISWRYIAMKFLQYTYFYVNEKQINDRHAFKTFATKGGLHLYFAKRSEYNNNEVFENKEFKQNKNKYLVVQYISQEIIEWIWKKYNIRYFCKTAVMQTPPSLKFVIQEKRLKCLQLQHKDRVDSIFCLKTGHVFPYNHTQVHNTNAYSLFSMTAKRYDELYLPTHGFVTILTREKYEKNTSDLINESGCVDVIMDLGYEKEKLAEIKSGFIDDGDFDFIDEKVNKFDNEEFDPSKEEKRKKINGKVDKKVIILDDSDHEENWDFEEDESSDEDIQTAKRVINTRSRKS